MQPLLSPGNVQIGLMRGGKFLAEQPPQDLLAAHMCDTLEDVFLKLSKLQNQGKRRRSSYMLEVMGPPTPEEVSLLLCGTMTAIVSQK
jgi:hypothetical protein